MSIEKAISGIIWLAITEKWQFQVSETSDPKGLSSPKVITDENFESDIFDNEKAIWLRLFDGNGQGIQLKLIES